MLDVLHPNWNALILNNYEAVLPIISERKLGFYLLRQSMWLQQLGVFSVNKLSSQNYLQFLNIIPSKYRKLYFRINYQNALLNQSKDYKITERTNLVLPLSSNYETLYKQFSSNTKRNIKKAEKQNLSLVKDIAITDLVNIYKTYQLPKIVNISAEEIVILPTLLQEIINQKQGFIWGVINENGELLAANFFWNYDGRMISILPSTTNTGREKSAMFYLFNELIKHCAFSKSVIDFEGSGIESIARFNKGFGATEQNFLELKSNKFPFSY